MKIQHLEEHKRLMDQWEAAHSEYEFIRDGILSEEIYFSTKPRIAFLLKEGNDSFTDIAPLPEGISGYGPNGSSPTFWRMISAWVYTIDRVALGKEWNSEEMNEAKEKPVNRIAYINIKKNQEDNSTSTLDDLLVYAKRDKEYLLRQIELIAPQVILCGGTKRLFDELMSSKKIGEKAYLSNGRVVIDFYHPSHRKGYSTVDELLQILSQNEVNKHLKSYCQ